MFSVVDETNAPRAHGLRHPLPTLAKRRREHGIPGGQIELNPPDGLPVGALSVGSLEATSDAP